MIRRSDFVKVLIFICLLLFAAQAPTAKTYDFFRNLTDPTLCFQRYSEITINVGNSGNIKSRLAIAADGTAQPLNSNHSDITRNVQPSSNTTGQKRLLFIRASFPDDPGGTLPTVANLISNASIANADYLIASYGRFSLDWTPGPTLMLPHTLAYYSAQSSRTASVLADAHAIASTLGYNYTNYDMDIVYIPQFYGVFSHYVGAVVGRDIYSWLVPANILNQAYGVEGLVDDFYFPMAARADAWNSRDNTVFGTNGSVVSNGDPYDTFGTEEAGHNYSLFHKHEVNWIPEANITTVTTSGTYRIYAHDSETVISNGRNYGLLVAGYQGRTYWIEYRQNPISGPTGVLINWGGLTLLDMTPGSSGGFLDAPLLIGQTFTDPNGVRINPTANGGTTPQYVDINVTIAGPPPTPTPTPTVTPTPTPTPNPTPIPPPLLLVDPNTNRAIALDSVLFTAEPFSLLSSSNFSADQHTRLMLFARNMDLLPNETSSVVTVRAVDSGSNVYALAVEHVGTVPGFGELTTVIVRLPENLTVYGDVSISISLRGVPSDSATLTIRAP